MKIWTKIILAITLLGSVGIASQASAASACPVTLQWQSSPDAGVAGYALYYGVSGSPLTNRMDIGSATTTTVEGLTASATYSFFVVAYDSNQVESDPSNFLIFTAPAISSLQLIQTADGSMNISLQVAPQGSCHVEYTDTLTPPNWTVLTTATADANGLVSINDPIDPTVNARFYRAVVP